MSKYYWNIRIYQTGRYMMTWVKNGITYLTGGEEAGYTQAMQDNYDANLMAEMNRSYTAQSVTDHF